MKENWKHWLLAGLAYSVLTLLMTWPLILRFNDRLAGYHSDIMIFMWDRWWLREAWAMGHSPYFTPYLFHPHGASLLFHSMSWFNVFTWLALEQLVGEIGSYNLTVLANFVICGLATFALIRYLGARKEAAFVGGLIYAFYPYHMSNVLAHPNLASVQWLPLYTLFLIKATRGGKCTTGILAGLFLALTALSNWHLLTMTSVLTLLWLVYSLLRERMTWNWHSLRNFALIGAVLGILTVPFLLPIAQHFKEEGHVADIMTAKDYLRQTDLIAYLIPSRFHPLLQLPHSFYWKHFVYNRNWQVFPGYVVLVLLGYIFVRRPRRGAFWALLALVLWVLALGPYLRVAGHLVWEIPLPYQLVADLPIFRALRAADRFNTILALPVSVLGALSVADLLTKARRFWGKHAPRWVTAFVGCLVLFEFLVIPFPTMQPRVSPFYESLRSEAGQFAVVDVPTGWGASRFYIYYQLTHRRPIVEGHISRPVGDPYRFMRQVPFLCEVDQYSEWELTGLDVSRQLNLLADAGVRYVIFHKDLTKQDSQLPAWLDWITLQPIFEDDQLLVYSTQPAYGRDFRWQHDLGSEMGIIQSNLASDTLLQGDILEIEIRWGSRATPERDLLVEVALVSKEGETAQQACWPVSQDWTTQQWSVGTVFIGQYRFQIDPLIPGGDYSIRVSLLDSETLAAVGKSAILDTIAIQALPRRFEPPELMTAVDISFGDKLRLLGYDIQLDHHELALTLHWQSLRQMNETWKFFVHVFDPQTNVVVAQADVMPHNWTYPTNWWVQGEYVDDTIVILLEDVPSGLFRVSVGVYHPETGVRLTTSSGKDQVVLPEKIVR
jgi:hypothetical protein